MTGIKQLQNKISGLEARVKSLEDRLNSLPENTDTAFMDQMYTKARELVIRHQKATPFATRRYSTSLSKNFLAHRTTGSRNLVSGRGIKILTLISPIILPPDILLLWKLSPPTRSVWPPTPLATRDRARSL